MQEQSSSSLVHPYTSGYKPTSAIKQLYMGSTLPGCAMSDSPYPFCYRCALPSTSSQPLYHHTTSANTIRVTTPWLA